MMCEHEFVFGRINATHCKRCNDTEQEIILREQLAAANARVVELETKRETRPVLYWRNKAEAAEAQCAAMRNCDNCNKWCMKQPNKSEFDTLNRMDDCKFNNLSHCEPSKKIGMAGTAILESNKRMRAIIECLSMRYNLCVLLLPNGAWQVENKKQASEFAALEEKP